MKARDEGEWYNCEAEVKEGGEVGGDEGEG
jgi:hypothetical protein